MAMVKDINARKYLNEVFSELEGIKARIHMLRQDLGRTYGRDSDIFMAHDRHLLELVEYVDWKLNVLEKGTSFDWQVASSAIESTVSVHAAEPATDPDFSGGYIGG